MAYEWKFGVIFFGCFDYVDRVLLYLVIGEKLKLLTVKYVDAFKNDDSGWSSDDSFAEY